MKDFYGCPKCKCKDGKTKESRMVTFRGVELRMRVKICRNCGMEYKTKEVNEEEVKYPKESRKKEENGHGGNQPQEREPYRCDGCGNMVTLDPCMICLSQKSSDQSINPFLK